MEDREGDVAVQKDELKRSLLRAGRRVQLLTDRLAFLTHSVYMRPSFQGLLWDEFDGLGKDELKIIILLS